ncbi:S4 domain-containing protein YaaA [Virgibacillus halophilus]|uniref:S4 domain-containing protein YaaA n=1 Tax=Tigheibacillus halophilus TaxID=361280 RepID=UPI0036401B53
MENLVSELEEKLEIKTDFIPLGQFLKLANVLESGGMVKSFLQEQGVFVNGELEHRRGRKLYPGDIVKAEGIGTYIVAKKS